jgi:hypothetical protein
LQVGWRRERNSPQGRSGSAYEAGEEKDRDEINFSAPCPLSLVVFDLVPGVRMKAESALYQRLRELVGLLALLWCENGV